MMTSNVFQKHFSDLVWDEEKASRLKKHLLNIIEEEMQQFTKFFRQEETSEKKGEEIEKK